MAYLATREGKNAQQYKQYEWTENFRIFGIYIYDNVNMLLYQSKYYVHVNTLVCVAMFVCTLI